VNWLVVSFPSQIMVGLSTVFFCQGLTSLIVTQQVWRSPRTGQPASLGMPFVRRRAALI